ncbi:histidine phosphatase family protein [Rhodococcus sp. RS1C4]|uniref:histidine phosphatase family protein n=1 Tax=Rhodococcoides fascians TaxID=1828 RepID=UPI000691088F|nr:MULTISPECIES: histidine phosphatase family protein [Rhodococcus]OZC58581.1 histidine phosphatase family protein [Rhodococcus sp. RS1C4]
MTTLLLVRHGATMWTEDGRLQGRTDIDLSETGCREVRRMAAVVASWAPRTVIASPLARTRSTAELLGAREVRLDSRWAEAGLGEWEGRTPEEVGEDYHRWRAGSLVPPAGELPEHVTARTAAAVFDAVAQPGPVLVLTHGGVIRSVLDRFIGLPAARLVPVAAPSITALDIDADGPARLRAFNLGAC